MKNKYIDLVGQTFDFPQDEFRVEDGTLYVNDINMMDIIKEYGTPLKITYLPKISSQIQRAKRMFRNAMSKFISAIIKFFKLHEVACFFST